jgi:hypothetical protein
MKPATVEQYREKSRLRMERWRERKRVAAGRPAKAMSRKQAAKIGALALHAKRAAKAAAQDSLRSAQ